MSVNSILSTGLHGMQAGINRSAMASGRIAVSGVADNSDIATSMLELRQGAIDAQVAANIIKTGDEILGTLIDIHG